MSTTTYQVLENKTINNEIEVVDPDELYPLIFDTSLSNTTRTHVLKSFVRLILAPGTREQYTQGWLVHLQKDFQELSKGARNTNFKKALIDSVEKIDDSLDTPVSIKSFSSAMNNALNDPFKEVLIADNYDFPDEIFDD